MASLTMQNTAVAHSRDTIIHADRDQDGTIAIKVICRTLPAIAVFRIDTDQVLPLIAKLAQLASQEGRK